jgi:hypothetical protein
MEGKEPVRYVEAVRVGQISGIHDFNGLDVVHPMVASEGMRIGYLNHEDIRALHQITDPATRQCKGQELFARLRREWESASDPIGQARTYQFLGELFEALDLPGKALQCYKRALSYSMKRD